MSINAYANAAPSVHDPADQVPSFLDDPTGCLSFIANQAVNRVFWTMLSGTAALYIKEEANGRVAALYLYAVAQQLPAADLIVGGNDDNNNNNNNIAGNYPEPDLARKQRFMEIIEAVGYAVTKCTPRHAISQSGILRALLSHPSQKSSYLSQVQVELCQACLMAEQYRFAARAMKGTWPRPNAAISVHHVLRYFLFRGMIYVGCNDWTMAVRCFWTCLTIPSEIVSALAVAAWKKLVLVQCLQMEDDDYRPKITSSHPTAGSTMTFSGSTSTSAGSLIMPKALPPCFSRFLSMASSNAKQKGQAQEMFPPGVMVQEEYGESSSQQQHQQQQDQQLQDAGRDAPQSAYPAMGVKVYMDLVHAFVSGDRSKYQNLQQQHANLLDSDGNMGLVNQCDTAMFHRHVYQLSRMYSVIPLADLAEKLNVDSAEQMKQVLQQLSMKSTASASKSEHSKWPNVEIEDDGMVVFNFESSTPHSEELRGLEDAEELELEDNIQELIQLTKQVEKLDVSIVTSPMYHALSKRSNDSKMVGPRGVEDL